MAESPAEQLAQILTRALDQWSKDNPNLFNVNVTNQGAGDDFAPGFDPLSLLSTILQAGILGTILGEVGGPIPTLVQGAAEGGGKSFVEFILEFALGWIIPQLLEPYILDAQNQVNKLAQPGRFDINTAADYANRQFYPTAAAATDALETGFDNAHFTAAQQAAWTWPALAEIFSLWNRGIIQDPDANLLMRRAGVPDEYAQDIALLRQELLSPADWALAALRKNVDVDTAAAGAAQWGVSAEDFTILMENTGEPPGTMQLLEAYRRDFIDEATLQRGILQSRVRDEWIPTLEKLRYAPMSTAAAANAVVRGYLSQADGASIAQQNGLEPDHWQYVLESNGRPPSHEQLATLYLRGIITEAEFEQGIRESDIKDKYITDVFDLRVKFLPLFEARTLLNAGEITGETFSNQLLVQGYQKEVIDEILKAAGTGKKTTAKHLTAADYTELYDAGILNKDQTSDGLVSIGYTKADADSLITIAETRSQAKLTTELITNIRNQFNRYKLTDTQAETELEAIGIQPAERKSLVAGWTEVRPQGTRTLTEAQVLKALKDKAITSDDAYNRLRGLGLDDIDARLLMLIDG